MLRGLYTAASGMITQQRRHDTITNNISNINTPGFKEVNAISRSFPEMLLHMTGTSTDPSKSVGRVNTGVFAEESLSIHLQGDMFHTGRLSDFAIMSDLEVPGMAFDASGKYVAPDGTITYQPQAFFTIQDRNGEVRYSRDGSFTLNDAGFLVTSDGSFVLGANSQPIQFAPGTAFEQLQMTRDQRFIDTLTGLDTGAQVLVSVIENPNRLVREGNGKFRLDAEVGARAAAADERFEVRQGYIERSNVDASKAMVELMAAQRAYESNQKMIQFYDRSLEKAVNEVGRVT